MASLDQCGDRLFDSSQLMVTITFSRSFMLRLRVLGVLLKLVEAVAPFPCEFTWKEKT